LRSLLYDYQLDKSCIVTWTGHPELLSRLRREFDEEWHDISPKWRTDHPEGKRRVAQWIVAGTLKALLRANIPNPKLWPFVRNMVVALAQEREEFYQQIFRHEQTARSILIVNSDFPLFTVPHNIGPWERTSSVKMRQVFFEAILKRVDEYHLIMSWGGIKSYWREGRYGKEQYSFSRQEIEEHLSNVCQILEKNPNVDVEIVPIAKKFSVNFEVIDEEFVFLEAVKPGDEGGVAIESKELAQDLIRFATRFPKEYHSHPEYLKGYKKVARRLREKFEVLADVEAE
jgi:hypothetical protein